MLALVAVEEARRHGAEHAEARALRCSFRTAAWPARDGWQTQHDSSAGVTVTAFVDGRWREASVSGWDEGVAVAAGRRAIMSGALQTSADRGCSPERLPVVGSWANGPEGTADDLTKAAGWVAGLGSALRCRHPKAELTVAVVVATEDRAFADSRGSAVRLQSTATACPVRVAVKRDSRHLVRRTPVAPVCGDVCELVERSMQMVGAWLDDVASADEHLLRAGPRTVVLDGAVFAAIAEAVLRWGPGDAGGRSVGSPLVGVRVGLPDRGVPGWFVVDDRGESPQGFDLVRQGRVVPDADRAPTWHLADRFDRIPMPIPPSLHVASGNGSTQDLVEAMGDGVFVTGGGDVTVSFGDRGLVVRPQTAWRVRGGRLEHALAPVEVELPAVAPLSGIAVLGGEGSRARWSWITSGRSGRGPGYSATAPAALVERAIVKPTTA